MTPLPTPDTSTSDHKFAHCSDDVFGLYININVDTPIRVNPPNLALLTDDIKIDTQYALMGAFGAGYRYRGEEEVDVNLEVQEFDVVQDDILAGQTIYDPQSYFLAILSQKTACLSSSPSVSVSTVICI